MSFFNKESIKEQSSTFIGRIEGGEIARSSFGKKQMDLTIQALDHETKGPYHTWLPLPDDGKPIRNGSRLAEFITKLADLNYELTTDKQQGDIGEVLVQPVGSIFRWERGKKSYDGGKTESEFTLPIEALSLEQANAEIKEAGGIRKKTVAEAEAAGETTRSASPEATFTAEDVNYVLDQFNGESLTRPQLVQLASKNDRVKANKPLQKYIMSGAFVSDLVKEARLSESNGTFAVTE